MASSDEDRELLLCRSQDLEWVDCLDGFRCVRCDKALIRHYISNCGHKFCLNCKKLLDDGSRRWRCPLEECKRFIEHIHLQDIQFERAMFELKTHCPNHKYGCPFVGPLKDIGGHLRKCSDTREHALPVEIDPNGNVDGACIMKQMSKMNEKIASMASTLEHMQKAMEENELARDRKWAQHDRKWEERLGQLSAEMSALKERLNETEVNDNNSSSAQEVLDSIIKPELRHFRRVSEYYEEEPDVTWNVSDINGLLTGRRSELSSSVFPLTGYPFGARAKIKLYGERVWVELNAFQGPEDMQVGPLPTISFTLKDLSGEGKGRRDLVRAKQFYFKSKFEFNSYYDIGSIDKSLFDSPLYNVDDQCAVDVRVEAPEVARSVYSHDGTLTWAVDDFRKKKQMEVGGLIEYQASPYFYTGPYGYRVQAKAYLNGSGGGANGGLSVFVSFLDGANDEDLEECFAHKTTVTLFHPTRPTRSVSKSQEDRYIYGEWFEMGSSAEVDTFLHQDTLYYKVSVEAQ